MRARSQLIACQLKRPDRNLSGLSAIACRARLCALDLSSLHAAGADIGLANLTLGITDSDLLDVGTEDPVGDLVGVANVVTRHRVLAANLAYF